MFKSTLTRLAETVVVLLSHLGNVKSSVLTSLWQMYIDLSCPNLGIGLNMKSVRIKGVFLDVDNGNCMADVTFVLRHVVPVIGSIIKKPEESHKQNDLEVVLFDETTEKVAVRFQDGGQDDAYKDTLYQYFDPWSELSIDPAIRFVCIGKCVESFWYADLVIFST